MFPVNTPDNRAANPVEAYTDISHMGALKAAGNEHQQIIR